MIEQSGQPWMVSLMQRLVRWAVVLLILVVTRLLIAALSREPANEG